MSTKQEFVFHIAETRHFEFKVWAESEEAAREAGQEIWRNAATVGQWELPDTETEYEACRVLSAQSGGAK